MTIPLSRRRLLQVGAGGPALSVAGCAALPSSDGDDASDGEDASGGVEAAGDAAVVVNVDEDEFAEIQEEISGRVEAGDLDRGAAQAELEAAQRELVGESVTAFEDRASEIDGITVSESASEIGLVLVEGDAEALIGALELAEVAALVPADEFERP